MSTHATNQREKSRVLAFASPPKSNTGGAIPKTVFAGIDWLSLSGYGVNVPESVREELAKLKHRAETTGEEVFVKLGCFDWQVMGYGVGIGASHMAYVLRGNGVVLSIAKRDRSPAEGGGPVCMLTAPGSFCTGKEPHGLIDDLLLALNGCGFGITRVGVSRIDFHLDIVGRRPAELVGLISEGKIVTRARDCNLDMKGKIHGEVETVYIGSRKSGTYLCCYDKTKELENDPEKAETYKSRWNLDAIPENLCRYEWRLNGDALRECHNVMNVQELKSRLRSIYLYLVREWYRECVEVDKKHPDRSTVSPAWIEATRLAESFFRGDVPRERRERGIPDQSRLLNQVKGCLASVAASMQVLPENPVDLVHIVASQLIVSAEEWRDRVMKRARSIRAKLEDVAALQRLREQNLRICFGES